MRGFYEKVDQGDMKSVYEMILYGIKHSVDETSFKINTEEIDISILSKVKLIFRSLNYYNDENHKNVVVYHTYLDHLSDLSSHHFERKLPDGNTEYITLYDYFLMNGFSLFHSIYEELPFEEDLGLFTQNEFLPSYEALSDEEKYRKEEEKHHQELLSKVSKPYQRTHKPYLAVSIKIPENVRDYPHFIKLVKMMVYSGYIYNGEYLNYIVLLFNPKIEYDKETFEKEKVDIINYPAEGVRFRYKISSDDISRIKSVTDLEYEMGEYFVPSLDLKENIINLRLKLEDNGDVKTFGNPIVTLPDGSVKTITCSVDSVLQSEKISVFWHTHPNRCISYDNGRLYQNYTHFGGLFSYSDILFYYYKDPSMINSTAHMVFSKEGIYTCHIDYGFYRVIKLLQHMGKDVTQFMSYHEQYQTKYNFLSNMRQIRNINHFNPYITDLLKSDLFLNQLYYTFYTDVKPLYPTFQSFLTNISKECKQLTSKISKYLILEKNGNVYLTLPIYQKVWIKELDLKMNVAHSDRSNYFYVDQDLSSFVSENVYHFHFYDENDDIILKTYGKIVSESQIVQGLIEDTKFDISVFKHKIYSFNIGDYQGVQPNGTVLYKLEIPENVKYLKQNYGEISVYMYKNYEECIFNILKPILLNTSDEFPKNALTFYRMLIMFMYNTTTIGKVFPKDVIEQIQSFMNIEDSKTFLKQTYDMSDENISELRDDIEHSEMISIYFQDYPKDGEPFLTNSFCCVYDYPEIFENMKFSISENDQFTIQTHLLPY